MHTDYKLGLQVHELLQKHNLENAFSLEVIDQWQDNNYIKKLEAGLADFIDNLGLDLANKSLAATPGRMVKLFIQELFYGLDYHNFPAISSDENSFQYNSPLISKNIQVHSTCEHHFVAIRATATIAYIPNQKIIGLGKLNQVVNFFAHRPQLQERLTRQILVVLQYLLETTDVAVAINASHDCIDRRCVKNMGNEILSIETGGQFLNDSGFKADFNHLAMQM
jgi:GTP cyclohydrolase I